MHESSVPRNPFHSLVLGKLILFCGVFVVLLFLNSCAQNSPTTGESYSEMIDHDWLFKLSTLRVRDETILKTQDRVALNYSDIEELVKKELEAEDIQYLAKTLGISPALSSREIQQLQSMGASPSVLQSLGFTTTPSTPPAIIPRKASPLAPEAKYAVKTTPKVVSPEKKTPEKKKATSLAPQIPSTYTQPNPPSFDPMSRR